LQPILEPLAPALDIRRAEDERARRRALAFGLAAQARDRRDGAKVVEVGQSQLIAPVFARAESGDDGSDRQIIDASQDREQDQEGDQALFAG
jgi:hypothetical protein